MNAAAIAMNDAMGEPMGEATGNPTGDAMSGLRAAGHVPVQRPATLSWEFIAAAPDAILVVGDDGTISVANQQALELFGYEEADLVGASVDILVPSPQRQRHVGHRSDYRAQPQVRRMADRHSRLMGRRSDGSKVPVEIALSPVVVDGTGYTMAIIRDITERLNTEREQAVMRLRLAVAEDRDRIARDLHDLVIQRLFATGMRLQASLNDPELLRKRALGAISELDETIVVLRESIFELTGPSESLSTMVENLLLRHDVSVQCDVSLHIDEAIDSLPRSLGEQLIPIINEALSNVVRHARAASVEVVVGVPDGTTVSVRIIDDGIGLDPEAVPGFGLTNLRQRAEQFGGVLEVRRLADGGTDLEWTVPIEF